MRQNKRQGGLKGPMKQIATGLLVLGDIVVLALFSVFLGFGSVPAVGNEERLVFLAITSSLILLWALCGLMMRVFNLQQTFLKFIGGVAIAWSIVLLLGSIFRFMILGSIPVEFAGRPMLSPGILLANWIEGGVLILGWRLAFWLYYRVMAGGRLPWLKNLLTILTALLALLVVCVLLIEAITLVSATGKVFTADSAPPQSVGIVFGSGLTADGQLSAILRDRVITAAGLYRQKKIQKVVLSGGGQGSANEVESMKALILQEGVLETDLILDYAGANTYSTCRNARLSYGVSYALLVTQKYHAPRALFTCRKMGIDSQAVSADLEDYPLNGLIYWSAREVLATSKAWMDVFVLHSGSAG